MVIPRNNPGVVYISPAKQVNGGIWSLFTGATIFLSLRLYCKIDRRTGLWYDDYILVFSWLVLLVNNIIITDEYATGYVAGNWNDRMHILINITSCTTLVGQSLSKTAFGVTLIRMSNRPQKAILWFCIISMNSYMAIKCLFQWSKYCGRSDYQQWYRVPGYCINYNFEVNFKEGGQVYNIIMDFVFALFPWWITWPLEMRTVEKIGLCLTLSLGMIVAVESAVRVGWQSHQNMHSHDALYMWRDGMITIWYSSEIAGTIIVQCIPILRPFLRDIKTTFMSWKIGDTEDTTVMTGSSTWKSRSRSTWDGRTGRFSENPDTNHISPITFGSNRRSGHTHKPIPSNKKTISDTVISLDDIPEEPFRKQGKMGDEPDASGTSTPVESLWGEPWRLSIASVHTGTRSEGSAWIDMEESVERGLSPPPRRPESGVWMDIDSRGESDEDGLDSASGKG